MPGKEIPQQADMFTGELVDARSPKQKKRDQQRKLPQQAEMFSQREIGQFGVTACPILQLDTPNGQPLEMALEVEDTRTEEEIEADRMKAAQEATVPCLPRIKHQRQPPSLSWSYCSV